MHIAVDDLSKVVTEYLVSVIVPKVSSEPMKFGLGFAAGYIGDRTVKRTLAHYAHFIDIMGIVEDSRIDIDLAKENALKALKSCAGQKFQYMGYVVDEDDVNALYNIMVQYAK